ncbi:unnamed protein product [Amoebophrya sp. A25]|nr:unnamed protein product [Amoebophrya sp. A25]|eukprot:GSA25T00019900001.1
MTTSRTGAMTSISSTIAGVSRTTRTSSPRSASTTTAAGVSPVERSLSGLRARAGGSTASMALPTRRRGQATPRTRFPTLTNQAGGGADRPRTSAGLGPAPSEVSSRAISWIDLRRQMRREREQSSTTTPESSPEAAASGVSQRGANVEEERGAGAQSPLVLRSPEELEQLLNGIPSLHLSAMTSEQLRAQTRSILSELASIRLRSSSLARRDRRSAALAAAGGGANTSAAVEAPRLQGMNATPVASSSSASPVSDAVDTSRNFPDNGGGGYK